MMTTSCRRWTSAALLCLSALLSVTATGCMTSMGGQSLPSDAYLDDDVQYHPAGPETQLPRTRQAHSEYGALQGMQ